METYTFLRELADSWVLLALVLVFLAVIVWAFRPGSRKIHSDAADIPFRNATTTNGDPCVAGGNAQKSEVQK